MLYEYIISDSKFFNIPRRIVLIWMYQGDVTYSNRFRLKVLDKSKAFLVLARPAGLSSRAAICPLRLSVFPVETFGANHLRICTLHY